MLISLMHLILLSFALTLLSPTSVIQQSPCVRLEEMKDNLSNPGKTILPQNKSDLPNSFSLSIRVGNTIFYPQEGAKVVAKIENRTGHTMNLRDLHSVTFNLSKYGKDAKDTRSSELFTSISSLSDKQIENGESFEFEVDLTDLTWHDSLSSAFDFRNIKNISEVVPAGDYYVFMGLQLPAENSTEEDPRTINIKSNEILVKWIGKQSR